MPNQQHLSIYNITGLSGYQNVIHYTDSLKSLCRQKGLSNHRVIVSSCFSGPDCERQLKEGLRDFEVSYNWIEDSLPLTVTFNHTVKKAVEAFGPFENYLYIDSGISFHDPCKRYDALKKMYEAHTSGPYAMTAARVANDMGGEWWGIEYDGETNFTLPVGKATNLHCQLYSEALRTAYNGKLHCDIFANDTSESVSTFLCAAIKKKFLIYQGIELWHSQNMDGASVGWRGKAADGTVRLFITEKTMDQRHQEGYELGSGYEGCCPRWLHDPEKFDEQGYAKDPRFLEFLRGEFFLKLTEFDYEKINHRFEP